jgi:hypothetical protein
MDEREERGVKGWIPFTVAPRDEVRRHRSDRWPPMVEPESPYRFFRPNLGRTEDLDKIRQRGLIGRTDVPSVVPILFFLFEILPLKSSPNIL